VLDQEGTFADRLNRELVRADRVTNPDEIRALKDLIERHLELTGSERAGQVLATWTEHLGMFWRVAPKSSPEGAGASASDSAAPGETDTAVGLPQGMSPRVRPQDPAADGRLEAPPL